MKHPKYLPFKYTNRWFCYLDLLGFKSLVLQKHKIEEVIFLYNEIIEDLISKADLKKTLGVSYSWFSDTFIIYSRSDSLIEFASIEQVSRLFFTKLIKKEIPVRGALTYGKLYSQSAKKVFIGEALIDAYEYGEKQKWLGFLLTPKVYDKLKETDLDIRDRPFYKRIESDEIITHFNKCNIYAYAFNDLKINDKNPYLEVIRKMSISAPKEAYEKYENTIKFIIKHNQSSH